MRKRPRAIVKANETTPSQPNSHTSTLVGAPAPERNGNSGMNSTINTPAMTIHNALPNIQPPQASSMAF
jgi:hypothetical protein